MEYTKNLRLSKPSYDDDVDVQVLNNNMDLLDEKVGNLPYLPLKGGKMSGDITLPFDIGLKYDGGHFLNFQQTNFSGKKLTTLAMKGDRLKYYSPSGKEFVVDDTGAWWNSDMILTDAWTEIGWFSGYFKISNNLILQWGYVNPSGSNNNTQHVTLQQPMKNNQYLVLTSKSQGEGGKPSVTGGSYWLCSYNHKTTGFDILCDQTATGHTVFWLAIGRWR